MTENFELAKPLGDRVLVEIESKEKTIGGIIIPDSVKTDSISRLFTAILDNGMVRLHKKPVHFIFY